MSSSPRMIAPPSAPRSSRARPSSPLHPATSAVTKRVVAQRRNAGGTTRRVTVGPSSSSRAVSSGKVCETSNSISIEPCENQCGGHSQNNPLSAAMSARARTSSSSAGTTAVSASLAINGPTLSGSEGPSPTTSPSRLRHLHVVREHCESTRQEALVPARMQRAGTERLQLLGIPGIHQQS